MPLTTDPAPTSVPAPVETTMPAEDVAAHAAAAPSVMVPPPTSTTTTTTAPPVVVAAQAPVARSGQTGQVTYYDHPAGTCASPWLAFGTEVEITNPANGESVSCVVNDREADTARSIDLSTSTFALIAPLSQGVIDAQLSW
jgi:rare lipoprotein A